MGFNRHKYKHHNKNRQRDEDNIPMGVKVHYTSDDPKQRMEDLEKALAKFKKVVNRSGLLIEMKEREYFVSPGRKRYLKRQQAKYRNKLNKDKSDRIDSQKRHNKRGKHGRNSNS